MSTFAIDLSWVGSILRAFRDFGFSENSILALLDVVSFVCLTLSAELLPLTQVSQKHTKCMEPGQILFKATYSLYLQAAFFSFFFFFFQNFSLFKFYEFFVRIRLTWDPMGDNISKLYFSHSSVPFQPNSMESMVIRGNIGCYMYFGDMTKMKILWHVEIVLNTGSYGVGNFKTVASTVFIRCQLNVMRTLTTIRGELKLLFGDLQK